MGGKSSAPPPPDYAAAAKAQGDANLVAGQQTAALNRPNQVDPNGTQTWTLKPGADPKNPQAGDWTVTNTLNPTQQHLKDLQDQASGTFGTLANQALGTIGNTLGTKFDTSGAVKMSLAPDVPQNRAMLSKEGLSDFGHVDPTTEASRQRITDALYNRQTAMLNPQSAQQRSDLTSKLAAQGITEGSDAYNRASDNQARQQADAYANARNDAILAGGAEDSRITNNNLGVANFANQTRGQQFGENQNIAGFNNNNLDTTFNQGMQAAGFNNTVRQNQISEALQQRELPMNEANALRTGNQLGNTTFQQYGGAGQIGAAPMYQSTQDLYNAQLGGNNANNANSANTWSTVGKVAGTAAMFFSDRRLKRDVVRVGTHKLGIGLYEYVYLWGQKAYGVMADEVKAVLPEAVTLHPSGFDCVDYAMVEA